jgi:hypothetical protein
MKVFEGEAIAMSDCRDVSFVEQANSKEEAIQILRSKGIHPYQIRETTTNTEEILKFLNIREKLGKKLEFLKNKKNESTIIAVLAFINLIVILFSHNIVLSAVCNVIAFLFLFMTVRNFLSISYYESNM